MNTISYSTCVPDLNCYQIARYFRKSLNLYSERRINNITITVSPDSASWNDNIIIIIGLWVVGGGAHINCHRCDDLVDSTFIFNEHDCRIIPGYHSIIYLFTLFTHSNARRILVQLGFHSLGNV